MVMIPLNTNGFAVNILVKLLKQALAAPGVLNSLEVVSHLSEEFFLVNSAVEFSENFDTLVIAHAFTYVSFDQGSTSGDLPGPFRIEDTETIRLIQIIVFELV